VKTKEIVRSAPSWVTAVKAVVQEPVVLPGLLLTSISSVQGPEAGQERLAGVGEDVCVGDGVVGGGVGGVLGATCTGGVVVGGAAG